MLQAKRSTGQQSMVIMHIIMLGCPSIFDDYSGYPGVHFIGQSAAPSDQPITMKAKVTCMCKLLGHVCIYLSV